ncbi:MAG: SMC-Scp complex subunit ScpB [Thermoplasmata archaeon]
MEENESDQREDTGDEDDEELEPILEAVLFSAGRPLTVPDIEEAVGIERTQLRKGIKRLKRMYQNRKTSIEIKKIGRRYSMQLKPEYNQYGIEIMEPELDEEILKTAALIAYYQPIRQSDLKKKIGSKVYDHIEHLKKKNLIIVERDGRTYSLRTSPKFQEYFGLAAKDRNELKKIISEKLGRDD